MNNMDNSLNKVVEPQKKPAKKKINPIVKKRKIQEWVRIGVQLVFFITAPSIYASAFTGVKNAIASIGQGNPLELTSFSIQLLAVAAFTICFGRYFCGWACAFGALGDWVYKFSQFVQTKLKKKLPKMSEKTVRICSYGKYVTLTIIVILCFCGKIGVIGKYSPWTVFSKIAILNFNLSGYGVAMIILVLIIIGMAFKERFFCQFLCPMGAVFLLLPNLPFFALSRNKDNCPPKCNACKMNCPVNVKMDDGTLREGECIRCSRCSGICPRGNLSTLFGKLKGNELVPDLIRAVILLAVVLVAK
jgi:ferredoxin-type protein NapH